MDVVTYALLSGKVSGVESMVTSLAEGFTYKGSKSSVSALPDDADAGDLYTVDGKKYVWDGTAWVELKDSVELDATLSTQGKAADAKAVGDALVTDTTLAVSGKAADAKKTGDEVSALKTAITEIEEEASLDVTVTGEIAFFDDGSAKKPKSVTVEIPYTSGGLSSMTMRFHRRNMLCLLGTLTSADMKYTPQSDGTITTNGTATGNSRYGYYGSTAYANANNIYNFPKGDYTLYGYRTNTGIYDSDRPFKLYSGSSTTTLCDVTGRTDYTQPSAVYGRVANQWSSGVSRNNINYKMFVGVGKGLTVDDWDAPATTHHELEATFGTTIYGGTVDLTNSTLTSKYASDGTELITPETISITVTEIPTLYDGANTIWASVVGSVVTVVYSKNVQNYVDKKVDELQDQIDAIVADDTKQTESSFCSLAMFEKIGIIGDSYAIGSLYIPNGSGASYVGTYNNLSWGKNIQRLFGNTVSFFAHGGLSTRTWLTDTTNGMEALETAAQTSPCNLYWFGLGINDVGIYNDDNTYLGSITDISGHESGTAWATTFYGNVGQIIERIQAASQYSKIVISSFVGYRAQNPYPQDTVLNNALAEIAEYYGLPFIDLRTDDFYISDFYSDNILGKHPIAMLYSGMALANARLFGKAVFDNQTYFKDYHMGTPIPDPEPDDPT